MRYRRPWYFRLGISLTIIGFLSAVLAQTDIQLTYLAWANSMQPWIGIIIGGIGVLMWLLPLILSRGIGRTSGTIAPAQGFANPVPQNFAQQQQYQQPGYGQPQGFAPQGYPQQPQGFAPQPGMPQQNMPPQQGFPPQSGYGQPQGFNQQPGNWPG